MANKHVKRCEISHIIVKAKSLSCVLLFATPWTIQSMDSPGKNAGVGSLSLLQGIFLTQRLNPGLLHCRGILYQLSHRELQIITSVKYHTIHLLEQPKSKTLITPSSEKDVEQ